LAFFVFSILERDTDADMIVSRASYSYSGGGGGGSRGGGYGGGGRSGEPVNSFTDVNYEYGTGGGRRGGGGGGGGGSTGQSICCTLLFGVVLFSAAFPMLWWGCTAVASNC
jgi:hypothetical protein